MNKMHPSEVPIQFWIPVVALLFAQSTFLFINARKNGHRYWFWGIIGLINFPSATILYFIFAKKIFSRLQFHRTKQNKKK